MMYGRKKGILFIWKNLKKRVGRGREGKGHILVQQNRCGQIRHLFENTSGSRSMYIQLWQRDNFI